MKYILDLVFQTNSKMKKIYLLLGSLGLMLGSTTAQTSVAPTSNSYGKISAAEIAALKSNRNGFENTGRATYDLYLDHSAANFDDNFFVWRFNSLYSGIDTAINYASVFLNKIGGYTDPADPVGTYVDGATFGFVIDYPSNIEMRIDSIFTFITHENNSGNYDYIKMRILKVTGAAPTPASTIFWEQVDSSNVTLSPGGNWVGTDASFPFSYAPNFTIPSGNKAALQFVYEDPSRTDTCALIAGFQGDPLSPDPMDPDPLQTDWETSYMRYPPFINNIAKNADIITIGAGNDTNYFSAQNWAIWAKVLLTEVVGVKEAEASNGFTLIHNYPNPSNELTNVTFEVPVNCNATLSVTDLAGRLVSVQNLTDLQPGSHKISLQTENLDNGLYNYTLTANGWSATKPLIVKH